MTKSMKMAMGALALWLPAGAMAQSINREQIRYELRQRDCREAFRQRTERTCDAACGAAAEARRDRCLAAAERRYINALRVQIRSRDLPY